MGVSEGVRVVCGVDVSVECGVSEGVRVVCGVDVSVECGVSEGVRVRYVVWVWVKV